MYPELDPCSEKIWEDSKLCLLAEHEDQHKHSEIWQSCRKPGYTLKKGPSTELIYVDSKSSHSYCSSSVAAAASFSFFFYSFFSGVQVKSMSKH